MLTTACRKTHSVAHKQRDRNRDCDRDSDAATEMETETETETGAKIDTQGHDTDPRGTHTRIRHTTQDFILAGL